MQENAHNAQCPTCLHTFHVKSLGFDYQCPNKDCDSKVWPKFFNRRVLISVNWDDLRVLCWFADYWSKQELPNSNERIAILNIINHLEFQRQGLIKQTGRKNDFGALTQARDEKENKKILKEKMQDVSERIIETINDILLDTKRDDEDEDSSNGGSGKPVL